MINEALRLHKEGFRVIPTSDPSKPDGKKPLCSWKKYQDQQTEEDIKEIFSISNIGGMALLTGDGIEVIDVDLKYSLDSSFEEQFFDSLIDAIGVDCFESLILSKTVSGGYHLIYKTTNGEGNQKLASRYTLDSEKKNEHDTVRVLLETRGEGGYILIPPTIGYNYDNPSRDITKMPTITDYQRNQIIQTCKSFEETSELHQTKVNTPLDITGAHKTTIEAFNEAHTPIEFLENHGWKYKYTRGDNSHYVRAGKTLREGIGAGYSKTLNLVRIFTSSTQFECNKSYNAFQTYAVLEHQGDQKAAAKELYHSGYGERMSKTVDTYNDKLQVLSSGNETAKGAILDNKKMSEMFNKRFSIKNVPAQTEYHLYCVDQKTGDNIPIASHGDLITIVGAAKSRKSALSNSIAAALILDTITYQPILNFSGLIKGRNMIIIDTEQNSPDFYKSQQQIYKQAELNGDISNLFSFNISDEVMSDRLQFLEYAINRVGNVGCVLLDGIVDLCEDYNDQKISRRLVDHIKVLAARHNILFMNVLHNARSTGSARGHLGTELINKSKAVIKVQKDMEGDGASTVKFEYLRGSREPSDFDFIHDYNGNLILSY